ncbi:hypothetical protein DXG01_000480 [Tephrocybe rancida]|nr:hypothetical protein DXG01_000480 [Tephrocybe rancida]
MPSWTKKKANGTPSPTPPRPGTPDDNGDPPNPLRISGVSKIKETLKAANPFRYIRASTPKASQNVLIPVNNAALAPLGSGVDAGHPQISHKSGQQPADTGRATDRQETLKNLATQQGVPPAVPGEWELSLDFLEDLIEWDREHPQNTLSDVLTRVSDGIEKGKPWIGLIPDAPFPAKTLVQGLAMVIQLGVALSKADSKLVDFALDVVRWIVDLKSKIASFNNEDFATVAWGNLAKVREIVDKICDWAKSRLADNRWTKLDMDNEIEEFKALVEKAHQTFTDLSLLTISGDISKLQNMLKEIRKAHQAQEEEIAAEQARREVLRRELDRHTATQPTYDQQGKLPCDKGSRQEVLGTIRSWIHDHSTNSQNFLWLTGAPGCGKSTITATIAQESKDQKFLWAQFFINRNLEYTTNPNVYFPTIARQLSDNSKTVEHHLHDTVVEARSLVDQISADQAAKLFIGAIAKAASTNPKAPVLVVIDGLDETDPTHLYNTATIFSHLFQQLSNHLNAKIMISSRTDDGIHRPFTKTLTSKHVERVQLHTYDPSSLADVGNFIRNHLKEIVSKYDLDPMWPGKEREERLVEDAAGLYIWAATVIKFLDAWFRRRGTEDSWRMIDRLNLPEKAGINILYRQILMVTYDEEGSDQTEAEWESEIFRRIMGAILTAREPLNVAQLDELLDLRSTPSSTRVDVHNFLRLFRTVLVSGIEDVTNTTVAQVHKSFFEYITGNTPEPKFRVDLEEANAEMAFCCLQHLAKTHDIVTRTQFASALSDVKSMPFSTLYALRFGFSHVSRRNGKILGLIIDDPTKTPALFDTLLPALSDMLPLSISLQNDPPLITTSLHTHSLIWDIENGSPLTPLIIPDDHPKQLLFSPDGRHFGSVDFDGHWTDAQTFRRSEATGPWADEEVYSVSFSPNGTTYAAEGDTRIIKLWDIHTRKETRAIGGSHKFDRLSFPSVAFAPDGIHVVYANVNGIQIWNTETNLVEQQISMSLSDRLPITLSSNGSWILTSTITDHALTLWNFHTAEQVGKSFKGHTNDVTSAAISPNSRYIVSGSYDSTVRLWDITTYSQSGDSWKHDSPVTNVSFSPDGSHVLSVSMDGYFLWDVPTRRRLAAWRFPENSERITRGAISPDGQQAVVTRDDGDLAVFNISPHTFHIKGAFHVKWNAVSTTSGNIFISSGSDNTLFLSRLDSIRFGGRTLPRDNTQFPIHSVAFSPDERRIAGACDDGAIHLWNTEDCSLVATYRHDLQRGIPSLSFAHDSTAVVVKTGTDKYLFPPNDVSSIREAPSALLLDPTVTPLVFKNNRRLLNVRWFPNMVSDWKEGVCLTLRGRYQGKTQSRD